MMSRWCGLWTWWWSTWWGRRGGGRLGMVGVGDGRRRGGDRRGKVDAGGCRRVADMAWLGCGRCRVVDVARSTRGVIVVSSTWRGRHGGSSSCRRCGVVMVGMWSWSLSPRRRGGASCGMAGGRHPWGRCRRPRGVGVADYLDVAWQGSSSWWTWRGVVVVPNPAWLWVSIREGGERWWWSTAAVGVVW